MVQKECALMKHKNILIATDGSTFSEAALEQAISFADSCNSRLYILHAIEVNPELFAYSPEAYEKMEKDGADLLQVTKKRAEEAGVHCETILSQAERPYRAIIDTAKEKNIDLIVMGTHGKSAITKLVVGSVTRLVIGHAPCAVLVVPIEEDKE